jgi:hypothetical protein
MARLPRIGALAAIAALLSCSASPAQAAASEPAVAHVSFVEGQVTLLRGTGGDVASAGVNMPVLAGDLLTAGAGARGEVQFDADSMLRFGPETRVVVAKLAARERALRLDAGTIELRLFRAPPSASVQTPSITIVAGRPGGYRVDVASDGTTDVTVRSGRASVPLPGSGSLVLLPGRTLVASGPPTDPTISYRRTLAADAFDRWNDARDGLVGKALASSRLAPALAADGLNGYGRWFDDGEYGMVWSPFVGVGWAPYTEGSWVTLPFYGPTWVSSEPWGWAPYHYGRWIYDAGDGWCWVPANASPWAPALVAFIPLLYGNPWGVSPFGSNVGWVPLAPGELYQPWWGIQIGGPVGVVVSNGNFANRGRFYNRTNFDKAAVPTNLRFIERSVIAPPARVEPPIRLAPPVSVRAAAPVARIAPVVRIAPAPTVRVAPAARIAAPSVVRR